MSTNDASDPFILREDRREIMLQLSMKRNSMLVSRMGEIAGPDDDWVSMGRLMNLLSAKDPNLRKFPPPSKFERSSSAGGILDRTNLISPKTRTVPAVTTHPDTIQVLVFLLQPYAF